VALQRPDDAAALLRYSQERSAGLELPNFATHLTIMEGLVAWSNGDVANAEGLFRKVIAAEPDSATAHHYLGLLLRAKGDARGAAAEEAAERVSHRFERRTQALATLWFWTDPVKGGVTRRR